MRRTGKQIHVWVNCIYLKDPTAVISRNITKDFYPCRSSRMVFEGKLGEGKLAYQ